MPENFRPRVDSRSSELDHLAASRAWNKTRCSLSPGLRTPSLHSNCCRPSEALRIPVKGSFQDSRWELGSSSTESSPVDERDDILLSRVLGGGSPSAIQGAGKRARPESSKHFGVRYRPDLSKWVAEIRVAQWKSVDKKVWLGTFETEEGAARAVDSARKILKCKKNRAFNFPCKKLDAYSVEIPAHVAVDDLQNDAMYKIVTSFVKKKSQEYAADFSPDPTEIQPLSLDDIPIGTPAGANDFQSLLYEVLTLDDINPAAVRQMDSSEFQTADAVYMEAEKLSDFGEFIFMNEQFPDFDIDELIEDPSCFNTIQATQRQCFAGMIETPHSKKAKHKIPSNFEILSWPELYTDGMGYCDSEEGELSDEASTFRHRPHHSTGSLWAEGEYLQSGHGTSVVDADLEDFEDLQNQFWQTTENTDMYYSCSNNDQGPEGSHHMATSSGYKSHMMAMDLGPSFEA